MKHLFKALAFLLLLFTYACSHPHTFIEVEPTAQIKNTTVDNLHIKWTIDEMTSMMLIMELDSNGNGIFEKEENDFIYENYFISLEEHEFYMNITANKKKIPISPKNFKASIDNGKLIYAFDIEQKINTKNLEIGFFDMTLFVGMMIEKEYITLKGVNETKAKQLKKEIFGVN